MSLRYELDLTEGDDPEIVAARLWVAGARGVQETPDLLIAWFDHRVQEVPPGGRWAQEPDRDWLATWREDLEPVRAGRVVVVPSWRREEHRARDGDATIELDPGVAFGSGHHATTQLCLEALQQELSPGDDVLDVGCGTGVLAIAAALLGAGRVVAVDVDPEAVRVTRRNADTNGVRIDVRLGGVEVAPWPARVVLANLLTATLQQLADALVAGAVPGGVLVASGVASERGEVVGAALAAAGAPPVRRADRDGWAALVCHRGPS